MRRFFSYYSFKMPIILSEKFEEFSYDPDEIAAWFSRFPDLSTVTQRPLKALPQRARIISYWGYYFWILYSLASLLVLSFSPLAGILGLAIGPFVTGGFMYIIPYSIHHFIKEPKRKAKKYTKKKRVQSKKPKTRQKR